MSILELMGMQGWVVLAGVLAGCGGTMDPAQLPEAIAMVWHERYHAPADVPPPLVEINPERCLRRKADGNCVDGVFDEATNTIVIGAAPSFHQSSLAHELYHADEFRRYGDCDSTHRGRGWSWYVPDAEAALEDVGL